MVIIYAATIFLSAFLLFQVQPVVGKMVLPWFGGSAAVWTTCMLLFQVLLLLGYLYAHLTTRYLSARRQALLHVALLAWNSMGCFDVTLMAMTDANLAAFSLKMALMKPHSWRAQDARHSGHGAGHHEPGGGSGGTICTMERLGAANRVLIVFLHHSGVGMISDEFIFCTNKVLHIQT